MDLKPGLLALGCAIEEERVPPMSATVGKSLNAMSTEVSLAFSSYQSMAIPESEIDRYLTTGDSDMAGCGTGQSWAEALRSYDDALRTALLVEVKRRESGRLAPALPPGIELTQFTRHKVVPMICCLFPEAEQDTVLRVAERSVVFLTRDAVHRLIGDIDFRSSAWMIANIYLGSLGLKGLDGEVPPLGCNEHTKCYVSLEYFRQTDMFADYVVHEVAHMFHNCKRETLGLRSTRRKEWLLDIGFPMREMFAYACEVYSRILELAKTTSARRQLLDEYGQQVSSGDYGLDRDEFLNILREAVDARNGWKRILARCSPQNSTPLVFGR